MAKFKGFLKFKLKGNRKFDVFCEGFPEEETDQVKMVSILRDENGLPNVDEYVVWDDPKAKVDPSDPTILAIWGKPVKKRLDGSLGKDDWTGDLIGDLTVTVQWGSGPTHSLSISQVVYEP